jgi:hypothetical protein
VEFLGKQIKQSLKVGDQGNRKREEKGSIHKKKIVKNNEKYNRE